MQLLNEQFNSIYSEYNKTQLRNNRLLLERQKEIHARIPEIAELDRQISELSLNAVKLALDGSGTGSSNLDQDIKTISRKKAVLLSQNGYPENYLQTIWNFTMNVRTAGIPVILAMKNATVSADASSRISMNNLIFKTFLRPRIFLTLMKNTIQMTMLRIPPE